MRPGAVLPQMSHLTSIAVMLLPQRYHSICAAAGAAATRMPSNTSSNTTITSSVDTITIHARHRKSYLQLANPKSRCFWSKPFQRCDQGGSVVAGAGSCAEWTLGPEVRKLNALTDDAVCAHDQDRADDLQRARLTSWPLDHRCLAPSTKLTTVF